MLFFSVRFFFPGWKQGWSLSFSIEDEGWIQVALYGDYGLPHVWDTQQHSVLGSTHT